MNVLCCVLLAQESHAKTNSRDGARGEEEKKTVERVLSSRLLVTQWRFEDQAVAVRGHDGRTLFPCVKPSPSSPTVMVIIRDACNDVLTAMWFTCSQTGQARRQVPQDGVAGACSPHSGVRVPTGSPFAAHEQQLRAGLMRWPQR